MNLLRMMMATVVATIVVLLSLALTATSAQTQQHQQQRNHGPESSGYVQVRADANMFWWLMKAGSGSQDYKNYPLVIWLQGGPGASSTGFGNFAEIGPLFPDLSTRNNTWLNYANLLFIDNPVGAGYSYVTSDSAYVKNNQQIASDLLILLKEFMKSNAEFETIPLTIFCESYGGKMTATFAVLLDQAIKRNEIKCNFKSIALGDSWISPIESTSSWSNYLYTLSLIDEQQKKEIDIFNWKIRTAIKKRQGSVATNLWSDLESLISNMTGNVNWYNILQSNGPDVVMANQLHKSRNWSLARRGKSDAKSIYRHVEFLNSGYNDDLADLMNGAMKRKLGIPDHVEWGSQSADVFTNLKSDFMLPVVEDVEQLLNSTNVKVIVYTGQLDLIVDTLGTEAWISQMKWQGMTDYKKSKKQIFLSDAQGMTKAFVKRHDNFALYWILQAGHMVPTDQLDTSVALLTDVLKH